MQCLARTEHACKPVRIELAMIADVLETGICRTALPQEAVQKLRQAHRHKMAVIIPYRDRMEMLNKILPALHSFLKVGLFDCARLKLSNSWLVATSTESENGVDVEMV